ncbi:mitochondrial sodium/calcium exchanger protein-like [Cloeon dipterum]|uniref:mitochondrial sodium/calcium exchanger protein-like n=1 Tax=Cloeon dipterum TaxID=197152 RepID=UPI00321F8A9F
MSNLSELHPLDYFVSGIYTLASLGDPQQEEKCVQVQLLPEDAKCAFVQETADCLTESSFVPYLYFLFCKFSATTRFAGVAVSVGWLVLMFFLLGKSANDFFCPSLTVIAKVLGLSESLAGVTILAFGNGSPDIFTSLAGAPHGRSELIFGELLGSGLFVTTVIAGSIIIIRPFKVVDRSFLRDLIFYLGAVYWAFYIFYKGIITTWEAIGFIILYLVYITVVLSEKFCLKTQPPIDVEKNAEERKTGDFPDRNGQTSTLSLPGSSSHDPNEVLDRKRSMTVSIVQELAIQQDRCKELRCQGIAAEPPMPQEDCTLDENTPLLTGKASARRPNIWRELQEGLVQLIGPKKPECCLANRVLHWLQLPIVLILALVLPVVNYTALRHGWCRPLNALHCLTCPLFCIFATQVATVAVIWPWLQLWYLVFLFGCVACAFVLLATKPYTPPRYHSIFAFLGFVGAVVTIYMVANEVVNLLRAIGILSNISDTLLGMTVLAWGNSIGDFITNVSIAKQGFERMGFSACFGGPLFNILLGIGISFTMATIGSGDNQVYIRYGDFGPVIAIFLAISMLSSLIALILMGFTTRRAYGIYLLLLYFLFLVAAILAEVGQLPLDWLPRSRSPTFNP